MTDEQHEAYSMILTQKADGTIDELEALLALVDLCAMLNYDAEQSREEKLSKRSGNAVEVRFSRRG